jgi:hypothetical protein
VWTHSAIYCSGALRRGVRPLNKERASDRHCRKVALSNVAAREGQQLVCDRVCSQQTTKTHNLCYTVRSQVSVFRIHNLLPTCAQARRAHPTRLCLCERLATHLRLCVREQRSIGAFPPIPCASRRGRVADSLAGRCENQYVVKRKSRSSVEFARESLSLARNQTRSTRVGTSVPFCWRTRACLSLSLSLSLFRLNRCCVGVS